MSRTRQSKATPSTWVILGLIAVVIILSVFSVVTVNKSNTQKEQINSLKKEVAELTPPTGMEMQSYQKLYPDMKDKLPKEWNREKKTVYLTFDDGPSKVTESVLKTLKDEDVKATFFVMGSGTNHDLLKRISDEGHEIGVHTYSHKYKDVYKSIDAYVKDYNKIYKVIEDKTGKKPTVFRYPGGSNNVYNVLNQKETTAEMFRRGFVPFDWNVDSGDAAGHNVATDTIVKNSLKGTKMDRPIILMHDAAAKETTAKGLKKIIDGYKKAGYKFGVLTNQDAPLLFSTPDGERYD